MNLYEFVGSAPIIGVDPSGNFVEYMEGLFSGIGEGLWDQVKGLVSSPVQMLLDPIGTLKAMIGGVMDLTARIADGDFMGFLGEMFPGIANFLRSLNDADGCMSEFEKGEAMGQMLMEVVPMLIPGGGGIAQVLSKFKTFQKVADKVKDVAHAVKKKASDLADSAMCIIKSGCFIAGTLVATPQGLVPIEEFEAGDIVYALDPESGEWGEQVVIEPLVRIWTGDIITIDLFGEEIETTGNHPFWVLSGDDLAQRAAVEELSGHYERGIEGRWVEARHIRVGDMVLLRSGESVCVYALEARIGAIRVYNLNVADWHTYSVSTQRILVHNYNPDPVGKSYETNTKTHPVTKDEYSGRTSGERGAAANVRNRDYGHHMNEQGYGPAVLDKSSPNADAIRGRAQNLVEKHGGARSVGGASGNAINEVGPRNKKRDAYAKAARQEFGE